MIVDLLSISRLPLALVILISYSASSSFAYLVAVSAVLLALISDVLDGFLARRFHCTSERGYILDGLGDRAVYVALILALERIHGISEIIVWLLIFREIAVYALRLWVGDWYTTRSRSRFYSKLHALSLRLWFLSFFVVDGLSIFREGHLEMTASHTALRGGLVVLAICAGYTGIGILASGELGPRYKVHDGQASGN